jgi:hypothetical protein
MPGLLVARSDLSSDCSTFHCQNELPLAVVGAFIRLGRKYDIKYLYDSAVARLLSRRPTTIEEYEEAMHSKLNPHKPTVKSSPDFAFDIVALASENNVLCVLPCAYYRVIRKNSLVIIQIPGKLQCV